MMMLLLFCHQVMYESSWPHRLQHTRLPCPSPSPRICASACPLNQWCHPNVSSSVALFVFCFCGIYTILNYVSWVYRKKTLVPSLSWFSILCVNLCVSPCQGSATNRPSRGECNPLPLRGGRRDLPAVILDTMQLEHHPCRCSRGATIWRNLRICSRTHGSLLQAWPFQQDSRYKYLGLYILPVLSHYGQLPQEIPDNQGCHCLRSTELQDLRDGNDHPGEEFKAWRSH